MQKANFDYSPKNIPTPCLKPYIQFAIEKTESFFFQRVRWNVFFADKENDSEQRQTNFRLQNQSKRTPKIRYLVNFENDIINLTVTFNL